MKKVIFASTFIMVSVFVGMAQNAEKVLKMGKWYANADMGGKTITLTKAMPASLQFDMELVNESAMYYGQTAKADFVNDEGGMTKAGTYYVNNYGYKINGNTITITLQPSSWNYNVKPLKNGNVLLELITDTSKSTK